MKNIINFFKANTVIRYTRNLIYNLIHFNSFAVLWGAGIQSKFKRVKVVNKGKDNVLIIRKGCRLENCVFHIYGNNNTIVLGEDGLFSNVDFYIEDNFNTIRVESCARLTGKTQLACTEGKLIQIGKGCLFSNNIQFRTGDSHSILDSYGERINSAEDIVIGNHVWIGQNVTVLKGSRIQDGSVVGSGSIVTGKQFMPNVILAGIPAKIIKKDIAWKMERI